MPWTVPECAELATRWAGELGVSRWAHVRSVARSAAAFCSAGDEEVSCAAWLHDVGYAASLVDTGMHAIDGARLLADQGAPKLIVSLVAYHTGAEYEADERGLSAELAEFDRPPQDKLDLLILADLMTSPNGEATSVEARLDDISWRYEVSHPVHRAVTRSREYLAACAARATAHAGQPT